MTKKNLIIVIILLTIIDLMAAGWYMSRRIEASGKSQDLFDQRDSTEVIAMADTVTTASQADVFEKTQLNTYYFITNEPSIAGDQTSYYTSTKHVKSRWPQRINGNDDLSELNKELIKKAFGNSQSKMKDARYVFLNTPEFNKPIGDSYRTLVKAPTVYPVYGNVSQVLVYPYMTSQRLLVMEVDKVQYNGNSTTESTTYIHYDRMQQRVLSRLDILVADVEKENKLLKVINKKIDNLNKGRGDNKLQHALNVPSEIRCGKRGVVFQYQHGTISSSAIEVLIDYDKLKPFFTEEFKQLQDHNDGYWVYEALKPEPLHSAPARQALSSTTTGAKAGKSVTPAQTRKKHYSGAKRKSGRHAPASRRSWRHRRR